MLKASQDSCCRLYGLGRVAPKFEQSALRTGSGPNSPSRLAPDPDLIKRVDPNEVRVGRQKNQNKYAPIGAYLELQSMVLMWCNVVLGYMEAHNAVVIHHNTTGTCRVQFILHQFRTK